jgi:hypothetical protein
MNNLKGGAWIGKSNLINNLGAEMWMNYDMNTELFWMDDFDLGDWVLLRGGILASVTKFTDNIYDKRVYLEVKAARHRPALKRLVVVDSYDIIAKVPKDSTLAATEILYGRE